MEICQRLARSDPGNSEWQRDLVVSHFKLYQCASAAEDEAVAQLHLSECATVLRAMKGKGMFLDAPLQGLLKQLDDSGVQTSSAESRSHTTSGAAQHAASQAAPKTSASSGTRPTIDPAGPAARAAKLNVEYQQALAQWQQLSWLKRLRTKKPKPPEGI